MKKILLGLLIFASIGNTSTGQTYDDGYISNHLPLNTGEARFTSYVNNFRSGINRVKDRELTSADGIASYYGIDIRNYPRLDQVVTNATWTSYNRDYSAAFLTKLKDEIEKLNYQYENLGQFRSELLGIAVTGTLSTKEAEALALLDISIQEVTREFVSLDVALGESTLFKPYQSIDPAFDQDLSELTGMTSVSEINDYKLPKWIKCGLGVIGSSILGGLSGITGGAKIGAIFGPGGAAVGAVIGGIAGVIGGAFTGAASFCD